MGEIEGVKVIKPTTFDDSRGHLTITYQQDQFAEAGIETEFIQDKESFSKKGVLRGLHFQTGAYAQAKTVRCSLGKVLDVVVDLRKPSPTFGEYTSRIISEDNGRILFLPKGLAHGFVVLSDHARIHYKIDNEYSSEHEAGIVWDDSTINIDWPIQKPTVSERDQQLPTFEEAVEKSLLFNEIQP